MEKIYEYHPVKFSNSTQTCEFTKLTSHPVNYKFYAFTIFLLFFILLVTVIATKGNIYLKKKLKRLRYKLPFNYVLFVPTYLLLPLVVTTIFLFTIYQQIVLIFLKLKYGKMFGGILSSPDAIWAVEDVSKNIINVVVIVDIKSNNLDQFIDKVKASILNKIFKVDDYPKLTCVQQKCMGYTFLLKEQLGVDDCVRLLNTNFEENFVSKDLLQDIVGGYSNLSLPNEHCALWEVLVCPKPMQMDSEHVKTSRFPILVRFSHVVGDGLALTDLLLKTFADASNIVQKPIYQPNRNVCKLEKSFSSYFSKLVPAVGAILSNIYLLFIAPGVLVHQNYLRKEDENALHGVELSGNKILVYAVEGSEQQHVANVKEIKRSIPYTSFSDVVLTAISGSVDNYFKQNSQFTSEFVTAAVPALLTLPNPNKKLVLQNHFSIALLNLPVSIPHESILQRLEAVKMHTNVLRNSPDYLVNHWLLTLFSGVIPGPVIKKSLNTNKLTMTISCVPGVAKLSILDGCTIEDIIFFIPHRGTAGLGFSILTYDNRFQLGLSVDRAIISSKDKAQLLVNNIFEQMMLLRNELFSSNIPTKK